MKILVLCDKGQNRSVTLAHHLKFIDNGAHDVLSAGTETNSEETLRLLSIWADRIVCTDNPQQSVMRDLSPDMYGKVRLWEIGPDVYKRPFNRQLLMKVRGPDRPAPP